MKKKLLLDSPSSCCVPLNLLNSRQGDISKDEFRGMMEKRKGEMVFKWDPKSGSIENRHFNLGNDLKIGNE